MLRDTTASGHRHTKSLLVARVRVAVHPENGNMPAPNHIAATAAKEAQYTSVPHAGGAGKTKDTDCSCQGRAPTWVQPCGGACGSGGFRRGTGVTLCISNRKIGRLSYVRRPQGCHTRRKHSDTRHIGDATKRMETVANTILAGRDMRTFGLLISSTVKTATSGLPWCTAQRGGGSEEYL